MPKDSKETLQQLSRDLAGLIERATEILETCDAALGIKRKRESLLKRIRHVLGYTYP